MDNNPKKLSDAAAMAQFRLALIAPVIHGLYPDASRNAYYQRMDLCQYFGQKKSKDYAAFFSSSSSFCCGVK